MGKITEYLKKDKEKFLVARFGEKGKNMTLLGGFGRMFLWFIVISFLSFVAILLTKMIWGK